MDGEDVGDVSDGGVLRVRVVRDVIGGRVGASVRVFEGVGGVGGDD